MKTHPIFARFYIKMSRAMEAGMTVHRQKLLAGLSGEVIEIGAGNGMNFPHYPPTVAHVLAVEPEPRLREAARQAATDRITVVDGLAERLPAKDASFDAAVISLVLCSVPDQRAALREIVRVLKPSGELRFLEHVQGDTAGMRRVQRILDGSIGPRLLGGCHGGRDTVTVIQEAGFSIRQLDQYLFPDGRTPYSFHVLGIARI